LAFEWFFFLGDIPLREGMFIGEKEHTLCSLIKLFLRELPNSLFGFDAVDRWFEIAWMEEVSQILCSFLPDSHYLI